MSKLLKKLGIKINAGEYIFHEGDKADALYLIHDGEIEITKTIGNSEKSLRILTEGEFVGEMSVIDSLPRSANAIAKTDSQLIRMDKFSFDENIRKNHKFTLGFVQCLSDRLRFTNESVLTLSQLNISKDITIKILSEFFKNGKKDQSGKWLLLKLESLINSISKEFNCDNDTIIHILEKLDKEKEITFKKDQKGISWVAHMTK